jgi:putative tryptophan/tyrosine transport system substrate-binding protein
MSPLSRRQVVQGAGAMGLGLLAGCGRWPGQAQPVIKAPRIAVLMTGSFQFFDTFVQGLRELGYVAGDNIILELRFADGDVGRLPQLAAELVGLQVDVIVTQGTPATQAAKQATSTIPIVHATGGDLVAAGLVTSVARPGGNVTGVDSSAPQLSRKRLELLKEVVPGLSRAAVIWNPSNPVKAREWAELQAAAALLGVQLLSHEVQQAGDVERALAAIPAGRPDGLVVLTEFIIDAQALRIVEFAATSRLPSVFERRDYVEAGGLMNYGPNISGNVRRGAYYVDRIIKGAQPADLPVEQPMTFEFVINAKTAQALNITIPPHVLYQATEVIQ